MSQSAEKRMGVSDARANMTDVIAEVRLLGAPVVLTRRDKPQAVLVSVEDYERAQRDRAIIEMLEERAAQAQAGDKADARVKGAELYVALAAAVRDVNAARSISES
ncbi:type II toxin-antitoxin system Phd/YefM family antitoxin [Streptomyces sp. WAC02707]|uniref:type II toxin-antitoxin system Phd/YefM family antitoxin n=1 Tax=Streptomyces sp. WAC02707 TaxID=2487417 RepID=UPI000F769DB2|nr:type II toxin-antitoxin system Phd/YefM family antitoxin [Streptomyces sp. WAC02707]RSS92495.1 type II toxin-antitoxin system Phd/YefM family antitoxin [Streptomyces sp. WAC02707]